MSETNGKDDLDAVVAAEEHRHKVLVAESDPLAARILKTKLDAWGYEAHIAADGMGALEIFRREPCRIAVIGMALPGLDGAELCRKLREMPRAGYTYIICIGDGSAGQTVLAALEAGADDFMKRPLHVHELRLRLKNAERLLRLDDALFQGGGSDAATQRINRAAFEAFLRVVADQAQRTGDQGALMFVRLRNYQEIMETGGFGTAHEAVLAVSARLGEVQGEGHLLAKTRPEEFCLLLMGTQWDACRPIAERIRDLTQDIVLQSPVGPVRPVVVVETVNFPQAGTNAHALLEQAERVRFEGTPGENSTLVRQEDSRSVII